MIQLVTKEDWKRVTTQVLNSLEFKGASSIGRLCLELPASRPEDVPRPEDLVPVMEYLERHGRIRKSDIYGKGSINVADRVYVLRY